jgi:hypothetical protein
MSCEDSLSFLPITTVLGFISSLASVQKIWRTSSGQDIKEVGCLSADLGSGEA